VSPPLSTRIVYRFHLQSGVEEIALEFDTATFALLTLPSQPAPEWAHLDFWKCGHCPLSSAQTPLCPFAYALSGFVKGFSHLYSYEEVETEVLTESRTIVAKKPLQLGIASVVGLIGATSGCPHLSFYRPMARFHLPFAEDSETVYRVLSMYLLGRYLTDAATTPGNTAIAHLTQLIEAVGTVNEAMAERIRAGFKKDAVVNAIVILDCLAQMVPLAFEKNLNDLRKYFQEFPIIYRL
jgi:hypothetical protein